MIIKLKKYKLTNDVLASYFEYASTGSFKSSTACPRIKRAVEKLITHIERDMIAKLQD